MYINKKTFGKNSFWATILVVQFVLFYLLSKSSWAVVLFELFFENQKNLHQNLFAWIPFSLGDFIYIVLGVALAFYFISLFWKAKRNNALRVLLITFNVFYFLYQIFWGMLYFQEPIINKLPKEEITSQEVKNLTIKFLQKCKITRELVSENKKGIFTLKNLQEIEREILSQQNHIPKFLNTKKATQINSIKASLYGNGMSFSGILGYYNPFTAEAQYNRHLPSTYIPFTIAHESSHQLGYAREQEANFIGYLIGINSANLELRYSTEYSTLKSLLNYLANEDPEFVKSVLQQFSPKMKLDRKYELQFIKAHSGLMDEFFAMTNNLFLRSNQQEGSITYSYFIDLLVRYERIKKESYQ